MGLKEKAAADEQALKQAMNDLHRYVEDPEVRLKEEGKIGDIDVRWMWNGREMC